MSVGFLNEYFIVATTDGHNFILLEDVTYVSRSGISYIIPKGAASDGASSPQDIWNLIPPFGAYWQAAFLHDNAYSNTITLTDGSPANLSFEECNNLFHEAMELSKVDPLEIDVMFSAVSLYGKPYFDSSRISGSMKTQNTQYTTSQKHDNYDPHI